MPILHNWSNTLGQFDTVVRFSETKNEWIAEFIFASLIVALGQGRTQEEEIKNLLKDMKNFQYEINKSLDNLRLIISLEDKSCEN